MFAVAVFTFASCDKDSEGLSSIIDYPKIVIQGDLFYINPIGETYVDKGCVATYQGQDYNSHVVVSGLDEIDVNVPGLYYVNYTAVSPDGYEWTETRTVAVCDPAVDTDISGTWTTTENTYRHTAKADTPYPEISTTIEYLCPGIFQVKDLLAAYYSLYLGYLDAYGPDYDFDVEGIIQLTADNKLVLITAGDADAFGGGSEPSPEDFVDGKYDPETGTVSWVITWSGMDFHVELKK